MSFCVSNSGARRYWCAQCANYFFATWARVTSLPWRNNEINGSLFPHRFAARPLFIARRLLRTRYFSLSANAHAS
jgi:hypothetical protein